MDDSECIRRRWAKARHGISAGDFYTDMGNNTILFDPDPSASRHPHSDDDNINGDQATTYTERLENPWWRKSRIATYKLNGFVLQR